MIINRAVSVELLTKTDILFLEYNKWKKNNYVDLIVIMVLLVTAPVIELYINNIFSKCYNYLIAADKAFKVYFIPAILRRLFHPSIGHLTLRIWELHPVIYRFYQPTSPFYFCY